MEENKKNNPQNFGEIVDELCKTLAVTLKQKNHDYGDSFHNQMAKHGDIAALLRMEEKMDRFENLISNESKVNESTDDTLLDLAGYAILTLVSHKRLGGNK